MLPFVVSTHVVFSSMLELSSSEVWLFHLEECVVSHTGWKKRQRWWGRTTAMGFREREGDAGPGSAPPIGYPLPVEPLLG